MPVLPESKHNAYASVTRVKTQILRVLPANFQASLPTSSIKIMICAHK